MYEKPIFKTAEDKERCVVASQIDVLQYCVYDGRRSLQYSNISSKGVNGFRFSVRVMCS